MKKSQISDYEISLDDIIGNPTDLDPSTYQYYKGLKNNRIIINKLIDSDIIERVIIPLIDMDNDESVTHIDIILNTSGGEVYSGMTLCSVIDNLKTDTTITILAMAASMGGLIAMAGNDNPNVKKVCYPFTVFLLHAGSYFFDGNANSVRDSLKFQESYEDKIEDYVITHSKISKELYEDKARIEWFFGAEMAKSLGIVDEIL